MKVGEYCKKAVVAIASSSDVAEAAKLMRKQHVGFLIVYRDADALHATSTRMRSRSMTS